MILFTHVSIAVSSVLFAAYVFVSPSLRKLYVNYAMIALTLISGSILVIQEHVKILSICTTGLVYIGLMLTASVLIKRKLAAIETKN